MRWKIWQGVPVAIEDAARPRSLPWRPWRADVTARLDRIEKLLQAKLPTGGIMATLQDIQGKIQAQTAAIAQNSSVTDSAVQAIQLLRQQQEALAQQLKAAIASNDPAALQAAADAMDANNAAIAASEQKLADAIAANTVSAGDGTGASSANIGGTSAPSA